jgi:hypothetical protein
LRSLQEIQPYFWRRPRPNLGCGAKERMKKKITEVIEDIQFLF